MGTLFSASDSQSAFSVGVSQGGVGTLQMGPGAEVVSVLVHWKTCSGHWSHVSLPTGQARTAERGTIPRSSLWTLTERVGV